MQITKNEVKTTTAGVAKGEGAVRTTHDHAIAALLQPVELASFPESAVTRIDAGRVLGDCAIPEFARAHCSNQSSSQPIASIDLGITYLQSLVRLLQDTREGDEYFQAIDRAIDVHVQVHTRALAHICTLQKPIQQAWISWHGFMEKALGTRSALPTPVTVFDVSVQTLLADRAVRDRVFKKIPRANAAEQNSLYGLIVAPQAVYDQDAVKLLGELGRDARAVVLVNFADVDLDTALEAVKPGGALHALRGPERFREHVMLVSNALLGAPGHPFNTAGVWIGPAALIGGMIYAELQNRESSIARAVAGWQRGIGDTIAGRPIRTRWALNEFIDGDPLAWINPVMRVEGKWLLWGCSTLSSDAKRNQYPLVMAEAWLKKSLVSFSVKELWQPDCGSHGRRVVEARIHDFLRRNSDAYDPTKPFAGGKVSVTQTDDPNRWRIQVDVRFKHTITDIELRVVHFDAKRDALRERIEPVEE